MRYVSPDVARSSVPAELVQELKEVSESLCASESSSDRKAALDRAEAIWRSVKPYLPGAVANKCWYCETLSTRAECDVDHYRPKSRVKGTDGHPGYYWLAAELSNFRLSCQYCNRRGAERTRSEAGGKEDRFPLDDEACRVWSHTSPVDAETPLLLDPTNALDPILLWIDDDGRACANPSTAPADSLEERKVVESLEVLNLNEERIRQDRLHLQLTVRALLGAAEACADSSSSRFVEAVGRLVVMANSDSEYSLAVRAELRKVNTEPGCIAGLVLSNL